MSLTSYERAVLRDLPAPVRKNDSLVEQIIARLRGLEIKGRGPAAGGRGIEVGSVILDGEGFEHNDLTDNYGGDTGNFEIQTSTVVEGSHALTGVSSADEFYTIVRSTESKWERSGIQIDYRQYFNGSQDGGGLGVFTSVDGFSSISGFIFYANGSSGNRIIYKVANGGASVLTKDLDSSITSGSWLSPTVKLYSDDSMEFAIDGVTLSATDDDFSNVYLGFASYSGGNWTIDDVRFSSL